MRAKKNYVIILLISLILSAAPAAAAGEGILMIPIVKSRASGLPDGWKIKEWKGTANFEVVDTEAGKTIHLRSNSSSSALVKEITFNIKEYPYLHWKWKVTKLPAGGDVRVKSKDDQAAQVYVVFPRWPAMINSRLLGYIWDTTAPAGSFIASTKSSNTKYFVVKNGEKGAGEWFQEKRNVYEDYKRWFNEEPPPVGSVSVMIDSDDTRSSAESFIGDIYFSKN